MHPFSDRPEETVAALGERRLIEAVRRWLGRATPPPPAGIGDDCAVLAPTRNARGLVTADPVLYRRHFDDSLPPRAVAAKLLKRNLSDIAAMGGQPRSAVVSLALPRTTRLDWLEAFHRGLAATARRYRVAIVGGDIAESDTDLGAFLTLLGVAPERPLVRTGAKIGDWIYVTGQLGGSRASHHWRFEPRLAEGAWLAGRADVRAAMDVSDGLAKDLAALTPRGARPAVEIAAMPIRPIARRTADPLRAALTDGEDYELVFALAARADRPAFERAWRRHFRTPLSRLGRFVPVRTPLAPGTIDPTALAGYEHLA